MMTKEMSMLLRESKIEEFREKLREIDPETETEVGLELMCAQLLDHLLEMEVNRRRPEFVQAGIEAVWKRVMNLDYRLIAFDVDWLIDMIEIHHPELERFDDRDRMDSVKRDEILISGLLAPMTSKRSGDEDWPAEAVQEILDYFYYRNEEELSPQEADR